MTSRAKDTGFLRNLISYDSSGNISLPANLSIYVNKEVATKEYVDAQNNGQVLQSRTLTINGTTYDLSANRSWTINPMVYPSVGIALSNGSGWGTSITNNSSNWNTAYGWGNHASAGYLVSSSLTGYATESYVGVQIANLVASAPSTLDTLNELAIALGNDPNFATSVTTLIGTKEPAITAGTTAQYWRGDKTWQTLPTYSLPIASASTLGGIKVGANLSIDGNGVLSANDTSVAWSEVTGKPTNLSYFYNDLGNYGGWITSSGRAYPRRSDGGDINFIWSGQSGQPTWLWGGNDGTNMYVYNPSNFSVSYATNAGYAANAGYATTSGTATDNTKLPLSGGTLTGRLISTSYFTVDGTGPVGQSIEAFGHIYTGQYLKVEINRGLVCTANEDVPFYGTTTGWVTPGNLTCNALTETSDIRFKNVLESKPSIDVRDISVIKYTIGDSDRIRYGYSAQQVQEFLPDSVYGDDKLSVNYSEIHTVKIASLEKRIAELEALLVK